MTLLDTIQHLSAGPLGWAGLIGAIGFAIKQGSTALAKRSQAQSARIVAEAEAAKAKAEAAAATAIEAARTERVEAEHEVQVTTITAAALADYSRRLDDAMATIERMQRRLDAQAGEIAALHRAIRRLGGTPTGIQAAAKPQEDKR
jgi:hypothetical protein